MVYSKAATAKVLQIQFHYHYHLSIFLLILIGSTMTVTTITKQHVEDITFANELPAVWLDGCVCWRYFTSFLQSVLELLLKKM